jgi:hypothetical protein
MSLQRAATMIGHHGNRFVPAIRVAIHLQCLKMRHMRNAKSHVFMTMPQEFLSPKAGFQTWPRSLCLSPELTFRLTAVPRSASRKTPQFLCGFPFAQQRISPLGGDLTIKHSSGRLDA